MACSVQEQYQQQGYVPTGNKSLDDYLKKKASPATKAGGSVVDRYTSQFVSLESRQQDPLGAEIADQLTASKNLTALLNELRANNIIKKIIQCIPLFSQLASGISAVLEFIVNMLTQIMEYLNSIRQLIIDLVTNQVQMLTNLIKKLIQKLTDPIKAVVAKLQAMINDLLNTSLLCGITIGDTLGAVA